MNSKFTLIALVFALLFAGCSKDAFNEQDAINAQKDLLNLQYQHELDLETLKQKGATALQDLINTATLNQLKLTDSLARQTAIVAKRKDYSVSVVDAISNAPVADVDVTVSSEGKVVSSKTNAQGIASFTALNLYPTSAFLISKTGYAATQILEQYITQGTAKLWNTADVTNEISGTLYIETDLTNPAPEKVGANVLVTASATIPSSPSGSYSVYFPAYTTATGTYSIKVPAAPNGYTLSFQQITADQKLFVNATEDDAVPSFPSSLPRVTTIKTYFNVNQFNAPVPSVNNYYYFKVTADNNGKVLYIPGYYSYYGYNQVTLGSMSGGDYQILRLYINNYNYNNGTYINFNSYNYTPNSTVDVELVDVAGNIIGAAPKLMAYADANGKLQNYTSIESGSGYVHLKRTWLYGELVPNAQGVIKRAVLYDSYSNLYNLNFSANLNTAYYTTSSNTYLSPNKGDKKVINYYYGAGSSRVKQVY
jgi:hypothetical protein